MRLFVPIFILAWGVGMAASCSVNDRRPQRLYFSEQGREVPEFNADSAYHFIEQQLQFGPRNPGSEGHRKTRRYLEDKLKMYAGARFVFSQEFRSTGYDGEVLELVNIIASFNTESSDRILLCAHWDTRPRADKDSIRTGEAIPGADDGGSGVGVLLELARLFSDYPPPIGVDIVLFDGEDYGKEGDLEQYFLGSRYWADNPPVKGYSPRFGILLDMVGGIKARFPRERYSMRYAPALVNEIWEIAEEKDFGDIFVDEEGRAISDDHMIINRKLGIPTIDIIRHEPATQEADGAIRFAPYWHTHADNMEIIDTETLSAVGVVMAELIYNRVGTRMRQESVGLSMNLLRRRQIGLATIP